MPKQKTRKSVLKRFKVTKTGKVIRRGSFARHLNAKKTKKRQRRQRVPKLVTGKIAKKIKKTLGY
ncbi:MAG TPA: 50S ribosomal protein L35 [Candidatus Bathyarchaeia archaeon]|nr:50S ribosomal protein L35 [Candidatus Bathyarchaeia archaeon]